MNLDQAKQLLEQTLQEEKAIDRKPGKGLGWETELRLRG
jgi:hypothetical protein